MDGLTHCFSKIIGLLFISFITGCTFTTTKTKIVEFKIETDSVQNNLKALVSCEHININGMEKTTNGQANSELDIDIINGSNIPSDENELKALGKKIASQFKQELKNKNDFNTYKVLFDIQETNGTVTSNNYKGYVFKAEEL